MKYNILVKMDSYTLKEAISLQVKLGSLYPKYSAWVLCWGGKKVWTDDYENSLSIVPTIQRIIDDKRATA